MPPLYKKKVLAPYRWLIKKVLTPQKNVILKAQTALATSSFSYQLGYVGAVTPPPPPPPTNKDVQYKSGTSIFSTDKDVHYEQGT